MKTKDGGSMMMLPAQRGSCAMCATFHPEHLPHNLTSLFYGMRFKLKYGRDPTWADACAHLTDEQRSAWRDAMRRSNVAWSETENPISEPYAISDP